MTREEVKELQVRIYAFYPRFQSRPDTIDAWHDLLKNIPYEEAKQNLEKYVRETDTDRPPSIAKLMQSTSNRGNDYDEEYRNNMRLIRKIDPDTWEDENGYLWAFSTE